MSWPEPLREKGAYAVYLKADIDALCERCRELDAERHGTWLKYRAEVHENALLNERLNRYQREAVYGDDLEWTNEGRNR